MLIADCRDASGQAARDEELLRRKKQENHGKSKFIAGLKALFLAPLVLVGNKSSTKKYDEERGATVVSRTLTRTTSTATDGTVVQTTVVETVVSHRGINRHDLGHKPIGPSGRRVSDV